MWSKSILMMFSVVLLATLLTGAVQAQDPNLVGWWTFDEGSGAIAHDASGHGYDGTVTDALWEQGLNGSALNFDAVGYVDVPPAAWSTISRQVTVAFWAYGNPSIQPQAHFTFGAFIDPADNNARVASCHVPWSDGTVYWDTSGVTGAWSPDRISKGAAATEYEGQWRHWTFVKNATTGVQSIYLNGALWHRMTGMTQLMAGNKVTGFTIGDRPAHDYPYGGMIDDFRLYNRALTDAEIKTLALRPKAYGPKPSDGAQGVTVAVLGWTKGDLAVFHELYVGTMPDLTAANKVARLPASATTYFYGAQAVPGTTYYWRIDEVSKDNVTIYKGDVWKFTMAPLAAYDPTPRNGDKWIDPNIDPTWQPGASAAAHDVYFSTNRDLVASRDPSVKVGDKQPVTTLELPTLQAGTTYYWLVDEYDFMDTKYEGAVWSFTTNAPGGGVKAEYFRNMSVSGAPFLTQIEPEVNHSWGNDGPAPGVTDGFSARWTADLEIAVADTYVFIATSDDGTRLWLNDVQIINAWVDRGPTDSLSRPQQLEPGIYSLVMEYYENGGGAVAQLSWQTPSMARQIIPAGPLQPPVRAKAIYPKDGQVDVPQDIALMWSVGEKAVTHDVYFGTDEAAVAAATPADAGVYKGSQARENNSWTPGALDWNKTYYWRIDEVNDASAGSPWKSAVWSFTTANFIVVDDFESYTDEVTGRIFQTWIDGWGYTEPAPGNPGNGTGSTVGYTNAPFAEKTIVKSGVQSMPLGYNNADSPFYSETDRTFESPQNWTLNGMNTLSLQVRGYPQITTTAVTETGGKMTLAGGGRDIWDNSDEFTYAFKSLSGDGTIVAKVVSNGTGTNTWAKGGVMIRDSLDGGSMHAMMVMTAHSATAAAGNGASFQYRNATDGASGNSDSTAVVAPPYWVKLERFGDTFTGYHSADGSAWTMVGTQDVVLTAPAYIGICVTSHAAGEQRTFQFESIKTTGGVTGQWQGALIASPKYNSAQDLYVAVQDSANKTAVVTNATAVNATDWIEVQMPLTSFTGVNMTKVKKMFIGVGNRNAPVADGTGMLFIDDIRVIKPVPPGQ